MLRIILEFSILKAALICPALSKCTQVELKVDWNKVRQIKSVNPNSIILNTVDTEAEATTTQDFLRKHCVKH